MDRVMMTVLMGSWLGYFVLHSWLAGSAPKAWVRRHCPGCFARYRLLYNVLAMVLLMPPALILYQDPGVLLWSWTGVWAWGANGLAFTAVATLVIMPSGYDLRRFIGLSGVDTDGGLAAEGLRLSGIHRFVRHPWYCAALVLIWTRDMSSAMLVTALLMTGYFFVGSRLEERRLMDAYGDAYRQYRRRVPGLFPWPGKSLDVDTARRLETRAASDRENTSSRV